LTLIILLLKGKQRPIGYRTPGGYIKTSKGWRKAPASKGSVGVAVVTKPSSIKLSTVKPSFINFSDYKAIVSQLKEEGGEWVGLTEKQERWGNAVLGWFADVMDDDSEEIGFSKIKDADSSMRKGEKVSPVLEEAVKVIRDFITLSPKYRGSISRGIEAEVNLKVGASYKMPSLSSFGKGATPPEGWEESSTVFVIKKNTRGADFSKLSPFSDEQREVVVPQGSYKVVDKKNVNGQTTYYFEEAV